jgi:hypothetical protein
MKEKKTEKHVQLIGSNGVVLSLDSDRERTVNVVMRRSQRSRVAEKKLSNIRAYYTRLNKTLSV